jgi:formate C-acetyltransferase
MQACHAHEAPARRWPLDDILAVVSRDAPYYTASGGGVTLSGGEPLLQPRGALTELLRALKARNIHVTVETALHAPWPAIEQVVPFVDLFLVDLKVVGDDDLHRRLTKQAGTLIQSNVRKLMRLGAPVHFRMVVVPGQNDGTDHLRAAAWFLKSHGHDAIELLQYHPFYEQKAKRLGLAVETLNISPEQSRAAIAHAAAAFADYGIRAEFKDMEASGGKARFTPRVEQIQRDQRQSGRALCMEACLLKTAYYKAHGFQRSAPIHRAECLAHVLAHKRLHVYPGELLVGNFTSKRVAGQLWAEYYGIIGLKMLHKLNRLKPVSFQVSLRERLAFLRHAPFWMKHSLLGRVYPRLSDYVSMFARASEMNAGFNNNLASIAHFIVNFERILTLGTRGIIEEIEAKRQRHPENNGEFYTGAMTALRGLERFADRYADHLARLAAHEEDKERCRELAEMSAICRRVPRHPARTFREALQSMLFLHIALCIESYENALSFGRMDQFLYPYYQRDLDAGHIDYESARELLCLFILKIDEAILVNDGNTFPELFSLFETISTDQAITIGGVDAEGRDATNSLTYMLIDACELQPLAADLSARVHRDSPEAYLRRIAEVHAGGCPLPQLFSDEVYIAALRSHYPTTLAQARNYAIVGCVEPNACDDHFGNTDCANVNVTLPLLQAIKGQDHDLWNAGLRDQLLMLSTNYLKYAFDGKGRAARLVHRACARVRAWRDRQRGLTRYRPPASMEELLDHFQARLTTLLGDILADHQRIETQLRKNFTTPLASSLSRGCLASGKDLYEGGATINSSGIQAVGITDAADSLHALDTVVFERHQYTLVEVIDALDRNFEGEREAQIHAALMAVPKFGEDASTKAAAWVNRVMQLYNDALASVPGCPRGGRYAAGYYALNVYTRYGRNTPALPSGRLAGTPLANSITPHYGMPQSDLLSVLNALSHVNFAEHAENGATATITIDAALFQNADGIRNLASLFRTFLTSGGMQLQPSIIDRQLLMDAYAHPDLYPNLLVRIAGYCAYFNELSEEQKRVIINRTCYSSNVA